MANWLSLAPAHRLTHTHTNKQITIDLHERMHHQRTNTLPHVTTYETDFIVNVHCVQMLNTTQE